MAERIQQDQAGQPEIKVVQAVVYKSSAMVKRIAGRMSRTREEILAEVRASAQHVSPQPQTAVLRTAPRYNKQDIIELVARKTRLPKEQVKRLLNETFITISTALSKGEKLTLIGFGTFQVRERKARIGRDPRTGRKLQIPAKKSPVFTAGKGLKNAVKGKRIKGKEKYASH